jgi:hypothetical protein
VRQGDDGRGNAQRDPRLGQDLPTATANAVAAPKYPDGRDVDVGIGTQRGPVRASHADPVGVRPRPNTAACQS